ncbi:MAG: hypothetical protein ACR2QZ_07860 [Woeseiaceae bacterium]
MIPVRLKRALGLVATFGAITLAAHAPTETSSAAAPPVRFSWNHDPSAVVVSYREIWGELAEQDPIPLIQVFGDGRVLVHHPVYTLKAGDYEVWLQPAELENLLSSLLSKGLATFEPTAVKSRKHSQQQKRLNSALAAKQAPVVFTVADASISVFELNLTAVSAGELQRKISWPSLEADAKRYPDIQSIQQLRAAELQLREMLDRDDLSKVR